MPRLRATHRIVNRWGSKEPRRTPGAPSATPVERAAAPDATLGASYPIVLGGKKLQLGEVLRAVSREVRQLERLEQATPEQQRRCEELRNARRLLRSTPPGDMSKGDRRFLVRAGVLEVMRASKGVDRAPVSYTIAGQRLTPEEIAKEFESLGAGYLRAGNAAVAAECDAVARQIRKRAKEGRHAHIPEPLWRVAVRRVKSLPL